MPTTNCHACGSLYDAGSEEQANEPDRRCPRCRIVVAIARACQAMQFAAGQMLREGGAYEAKGRQLRGAANVIFNWIAEIKES